MSQLILQDGTQYCGENFGAAREATGEVVFSTGMTGYPESLTDPSYAGQILVLTYPLIGNYGVPAENLKKKQLKTKMSADPFTAEILTKKFESAKIQIAGLIVSEYSQKYSHSEASLSLSAWLKRENIPALTRVDTRALTQKLRKQGTILGKISLQKKFLKFCKPAQSNLVQQVSIPKPIFYRAGNKKVVLIDCGLKLSILRNLLSRNVSVWRLPFDADLRQFDFDGICLSSGPGDPIRVPETCHTIKRELKNKKPIFGICLGHQILALAAGGHTFKLPYGHRSQNQPVQNLKTGHCFITSQNHGYAVDPKLPSDFQITFQNLNDKSVEGLQHKTKPFVSIQFHPEAQPGPADTEFLFDEFVAKLGKSS